MTNHIPYWKHQKNLFLLLSFLFFFPGCTTEGDTEEIEKAVVSIEVTSQRGDWYSPWQRGRSQGGSGSGFIVAPGQIMTNAHVVSDAKQILVKRAGSSKPYFAEVAYISHDSDLALLTVKDSEFDKDVTPLKIGALPSLRTRVRTYGFPAGGDRLARTEGVVSRIEFITYAHSGSDAHLGVQTDSAINPGSSGGPVVQNGMVVGVAFQANTRLNDVGFFIPTTVINRFLEDIKDEKYEGTAEMGIVTSSLINPAYRKFLGLDSGSQGVVVDRLLLGSSAVNHILPGDVILSIEGIPIDFNGNINYQEHQLGFAQVAEEKQVGYSLTLEIWRNKEKKSVTFPLGVFTRADRLRNQFDVLPNFFLYSGLVFTTLEKEYLKTYGNYWKNASKKLLYYHFFRSIEKPEADNAKPIILSRILPHRVNSAYRNRNGAIITSINGMAIKFLSDIPKALTKSRKGFHVIELQGSGIIIVLDSKKAEKAHREIMETYGIKTDRRLS